MDRDTKIKSQQGAVLIEGAIFLSLLAAVIAGVITLLIQLRFEILTYEALRKSSSELTAWKPPTQRSNGEELREAQCRDLKEIVTTQLKHVGLNAADFEIKVRPQNAEINISRNYQEILVRSNGTNSIIERFFYHRDVTFSYVPSPSVAIADCEGQRRSGLGGSGE